MSKELEALREEVANLKNELSLLKQALGIEQLDEQSIEKGLDLVCNSIRIVKNGNVLLYIGDYGNKGKAAVIQLKCANGNRIQIQGLYYENAIRMYANNTNDLLFSLGADSQNGTLAVYNTNTGSSAKVRVSQASGIVETYDKDGDISMRMT